jgi:hypothetical protein
MRNGAQLQIIRRRLLPPYSRAVQEHYPGDGGSRLLGKAANYTSNYTASHPRK